MIRDLAFARQKYPGPVRQSWLRISDPMPKASVLSNRSKPNTPKPASLTPAPSLVSRGRLLLFFGPKLDCTFSRLKLWCSRMASIVLWGLFGVNGFQHSLSYPFADLLLFTTYVLAIVVVTFDSSICVKSFRLIQHCSDAVAQMYVVCLHNYADVFFFSTGMLIWRCDIPLHSMNIVLRKLHHSSTSKSRYKIQRCSQKAQRFFNNNAFSEKNL